MHPIRLSGNGQLVSDKVSKLKKKKSSSRPELPPAAAAAPSCCKAVAVNAPSMPSQPAMFVFFLTNKIARKSFSGEVRYDES